jgi:hypothetical protein
MDITLGEVLKVYGPLGALAFVGCAAAVILFKTLSRERDKHAARIEALSAEHKAEMQVMVERYIQTTTTQIEQYHVLADKLHGMIESIARRLDRR